MIIKIAKYTLHFKQASGTSRGVLHTKDTWFIKIYQKENDELFGLGEINMFQGLSFDDTPQFHLKLKELEQNPEYFIDHLHSALLDFPAIRFGLENALLDFHQKRNRIIFPSNFTQGKEGIPINGLIWMGDKDFMLQQIQNKLDSGFKCLKMKIGAINFDTELSILQSIRKKYNHHDLELRVDANGAFNHTEALLKLKTLSKLNLHSIEQPIRQGNWEAMRNLCLNTPLPIALDEELIGVNNQTEKAALLSEIQPQYIILKPALVGGFQASDEWIRLADENNIDWWVTSALESNIGLSAIAQWTYQVKKMKYQGLGTGQLYTNNIESPLNIKGEELFYHPENKWAE